MKVLSVREYPIRIPKTMSPPPQEGGGLPDLLRQTLVFVRRSWRAILLCSLIGVLVARLILSQLDRRYQSTIRILVDPPQRSPIDSEQLSAALLESFVEGQVFLVESTEVLYAVVQRENLTDLPYFQSP